MGNKNKRQKGFTLIELLVVVAIIALLTSIALIALVSARQKSRNTKRLSDMVQMLNGLELFNAHNKGYPADSDANGIPDALSPTFAATIPTAPLPPDSIVCETNYSPCGAVNQPACVTSNTYWYVPLGTSQVVNGLTVYPDFDYYFCLGDQTGNFAAGVRTLTPQGVR
ncbi:MAG: type II secretion system protein [Candidatus Doudnabacteria bacterium]|nr:type II secretion system protein [Candidatus Doudnabacteria bacterium]